MDNFRKNATRATVAVLVTLGTLLGGAGLASAAPPDPGGAGAELTSVSGSVETWVEDFGVAALGGLLLLGVVIALMIKFGKRTKSVI